MNKNLQKKFELLEKRKQEFINFISGMPTESLNFVPSENKWSIIQVFFHVVKTELYIVSAVNNSLNHRGRLHDIGFEEIVYSTVLDLTLRSPFKIKAPPILANMPEFYDVNELIKKWNTVRKKLNELLSGFDSGLMNKNVFAHPYSGEMNIGQTLNFMSVHISHHLKRIDKMKKKHQL